MSVCIDEYEQELFDVIFNDEYQMMMNLKAKNKNFKKEVDQYLRMAYITSDDNWIGSGRYDDIMNHARIAAIELVKATLSK